MGLRRMSHTGKARSLFRGRQGSPPPTLTDGVRFFSMQNFPLIRKQLLGMVQSCPDRKDTGKLTTAPCCRVENGRVFHCQLYGHQPAKLYDCLQCRKRFAIEEDAQWIKPLLQLSRGSDLSQSLQEVQSAVGSSGDQQTAPVKELPGRLGTS